MKKSVTEILQELKERVLVDDTLFSADDLAIIEKCNFTPEQLLTLIEEEESHREDKIQYKLKKDREERILKDYKQTKADIYELEQKAKTTNLTQEEREELKDCYNYLNNYLNPDAEKIIERKRRKEEREKQQSPIENKQRHFVNLMEFCYQAGALDETEQEYLDNYDKYIVSEKRLVVFMECSKQTIYNYRERGILPQPVMATPSPKGNGETRYYNLLEAVKRIEEFKIACSQKRSEKLKEGKKPKRNKATGRFKKG